MTSAAAFRFDSRASGTLGASNNDSWFDGKVLSYAVSSAVSISKGDFVKLKDTGTNRQARGL